MDRKFKIGEKVKVNSIDNYGNILSVGAIGLVINPNHFGAVKVQLRNFNLGHGDYNDEWNFNEAELDLIEETIGKNPPQNNLYGERKNSNKLRWRNVPLFILQPVIEVGALAEKRPDNPKGKYETFNFLKGMAANDTLDSLKRHLEAFESPYEADVDTESGLSHLAHIAWNALVLLHSLKQYPELDDRYKLPEQTQLNPEEIQKRGR